MSEAVGLDRALLVRILGACSLLLPLWARSIGHLDGIVLSKLNYALWVSDSHVVEALQTRPLFPTESCLSSGFAWAWPA